MALPDARDARHDLAWRAIATLQRVAVDERLLQWMQAAVVFQALDRGDLGPVVHDRQGQARHHTFSVEMDGAGAACALVAALFRAGEPDAFTQHVQQRGAVVDVDHTLLAVDAHPYCGRFCLGFNIFSGTTREQRQGHRTADRDRGADERASSDLPRKCFSGVVRFVCRHVLSS